MVRRQDISACETQCAWAANLASCSQTDISCYCNVVKGAGSNVASCAACLQPINATLASSIQEIETICASSASGGSPVTSPTLPLGGTTSATSGNSISCASQCSNIATALDSCADVACFCPTLLASGSMCSKCFATVNATEASLLSVAISECQTIITPTVTNPGGATQCSSQCGLVYSAAASCSEVSCICPTVLAQGPQCSSCWLTVNATEAIVIGSILTACQTAIYSSTSQTRETVRSESLSISSIASSGISQCESGANF